MARGAALELQRRLNQPSSGRQPLALKLLKASVSAFRSVSRRLRGRPTQNPPACVPRSSRPWEDLPQEIIFDIAARLLPEPYKEMMCNPENANSAVAAEAFALTTSTQQQGGFVACAEVCRSWRKACIEHHNDLPNKERLLLFPASLSDRGPNTARPWSAASCTTSGHFGSSTRAFRAPTARCLESFSWLPVRAPGTTLGSHCTRRTSHLLAANSWAVS